MRTFVDAENGCVRLGTGVTLPMIHSAEEQDFLSNYLFNKSQHANVEDFWLGARFTSKNYYQWIDGSSLDYVNWDSNKSPTNHSNYCLEMESDLRERGKWIDQSCDKKNRVVCQKRPIWSQDELQKALLELRKEFRSEREQFKRELEKSNQNNADLTRKLNEINVQLTKEILKSEQQIADLKDNLIPIGFLYFQLPNEKSPEEIWHWLSWTDVSDSYANVFFRVIGNNTARFGAVQEESCPRISEVEHAFETPLSHYNHIVLPQSGWSDYLYEGTEGTSELQALTRFYTLNDEVRPRNMAIRVWRRTA